MLQQTIETDLLEFSESKGMDISRTRAAIKKHQLRPEGVLLATSKIELPVRFVIQF